MCQKRGTNLLTADEGPSTTVCRSAYLLPLNVPDTAPHTESFPENVPLMVLPFTVPWNVMPQPAPPQLTLEPLIVPMTLPEQFASGTDHVPETELPFWVRFALQPPM